jgi:hypothetical protein
MVSWMVYTPSSVGEMPVTRTLSPKANGPPQGRNKSRDSASQRVWLP